MSLEKMELFLRLPQHHSIQAQKLRYFYAALSLKNKHLNSYFVFLNTSQDSGKAAKCGIVTLNLNSYFAFFSNITGFIASTSVQIFSLQ
jgi:hypothetical protein